MSHTPDDSKTTPRKGKGGCSPRATIPKFGLPHLNLNQCFPHDTICLLFSNKLAKQPQWTQLNINRKGEKKGSVDKPSQAGKTTGLDTPMTSPPWLFAKWMNWKYGAAYMALKAIAEGGKMRFLWGYLSSAGIFTISFHTSGPYTWARIFGLLYCCMFHALWKANSSILYPLYPILPILSPLSYPIYPIPSVLAYLSYSTCPSLSIPSVPAYLSYPLYPILSILSPLSYPIYPVPSILSPLS